MARFERLAQDLETSAMKLGQLVEEQHAVVRQADLAGRRRGAAADHAGIADRVVRIAEWPRHEKRFVGPQPSQGTVDARRFQALAGVQGRQDSRQPSRQHRLAGPGTADHQHVVRASGSYDQGALGELLSAHVREIDIVVVEPGEQLVDLRGDGLSRQLAGENADRLGE